MLAPTHLKSVEDISALPTVAMPIVTVAPVTPLPQSTDVVSSITSYMLKWLHRLFSKQSVTVELEPETVLPVSTVLPRIHNEQLYLGDLPRLLHQGKIVIGTDTHLHFVDTGERVLTQQLPHFTLPERREA